MEFDTFSTGCKKYSTVRLIHKSYQNIVVVVVGVVDVYFRTQCVISSKYSEKLSTTGTIRSVSYKKPAANEIRFFFVNS